MRLENGLFSTPEFAAFVKESRVHLFCHIQSNLPEQTRPELWREKGGRSHPHIAILSAEGEVLAIPAERSIASFREALVHAKDPKARQAAAAAAKLKREKLGQRMASDRRAYREVDPGSIDRTIAEEPKYVGKPLYALFVFGPTGDARMWAAVDRSRADLDEYDILYLDKNFNGKLTDPGERFTTRQPGPGVFASQIKVGRISVPGTNLEHTKVQFFTRQKWEKGKAAGFIHHSLRWDDVVTMTGGYAEGPGGLMKWAPNLKDAPVIRPTPLAPYRFASSYGSGGDVETVWDGKWNASVLLGSQAWLGQPISAVDEFFLDLERDEITVTLVAKDTAGKEVRVKKRLNDRC